jgi:hypothetical protein
MPQIFHPSTNTIARAMLFGSLIAAAAGGWAVYEFNRSPYVTEAAVPRSQPVMFSHEHHVSGLGLDCRYCHTSVENSSFAGIPPTKTCMTCHSQIWTNAQLLEPVRASWRTDTPLQWTRVNDLPDFAHFDHAMHIQKGMGCSTCHGQVDQMPLTWKAASLQMEWCLQCHRQPEQFIRPREEVFNMDWRPPADQLAMGKKLVEQYHVNKPQMTNCSVCHY